MTKTHLTIATRESPLALWQANWVRSMLEKYHPHLSVSLLSMTTQADRMPYISLAEMGGKGLFVKELEQALLDGLADVAVHSMKDMAMDLPQGLCLPVICQREQVNDVLLSNTYSSLAEIPPHAIIGTSSLRRQSQVLALRPDLQVKPLRGNVNTRLAKLDENNYAAIILAMAGLQRLGFQHRISEVLNVQQFLPAAGQGALGLECRENDEETMKLIAPLKHEATFHCVMAERAMCRHLRVGCQVPVGALAVESDGILTLQAYIGRIDGTCIIRAKQVGKIEDVENIGIAVAQDLLRLGAGDVLRSLGQYE
jgi:hydroxymethylbilane synthase